MQYHFTIGVLLGAVLVVMGNAYPIPRNASSVGTSKPSFSPDYSSVVGTFTAVAASSQTSAAVHSDRFGIFSGSPANFGGGHIILEDGDVDVSLSSSTIGTPTRTASPHFVGFQSHFGHGPIVPGRGFHPKINETANHTSPRTSFSGTHNIVRCESAAVWFTCDMWMRLKAVGVFLLGQDKHYEGHKRTQNETTHKPPQARSIYTAALASLPTTTTSSPALSIQSGNHLPNHRGHTQLNQIDFQIALRDVEQTIRLEEEKIEYFKKQINNAQADLARVFKLIDPEHNSNEISGTNLYLRVAKEQTSFAEEHLKSAEDEKKQWEQERFRLVTLGGY